MNLDEHFCNFLTELNKALSQEQMCNAAIAVGAGELRSNIIESVFSFIV